MSSYPPVHDERTKQFEISELRVFKGMRIGFLTGSITRIGSGRAEAVPLARALSQLDCSVYGLETTRFRRGRKRVENLDVHLQPRAPYLFLRFGKIAQSFLRRLVIRGHTAYANGLGPFDLATGDALLSLANQLQLDVVYAFHNTNVARILRGWPHSSRLLVINLIGFGIDPSRGGAANTFPLQNLIFERPFWDLHIAATRFEYEQYATVYEQLGIDPGKLMHLPHSYDEELFHPPLQASNGKRPPSPTGAKTILYPVNVYPRKNIELAIDVLSVLNRDMTCRLVVTGKIWDEGYYGDLLKRAQERDLADRVEFLGGVPLTRLIQCYQQADVTVYTSHQETFGHGIVESLGCGTPVVGPDWIIASREILDESPGGSAAPKEPHAFAAAIRETLQANDSSELLASSASARYGNRSVARRLLEKCRGIKARKETYRSAVSSINWKGLYQDAGDLL